MRHDRVTGAAASPTVNRLRPVRTFVPASQQTHDTSGVRRRDRRAAARAAAKEARA